MVAQRRHAPAENTASQCHIWYNDDAQMKGSGGVASTPEHGRTTLEVAGMSTLSIPLSGGKSAAQVDEADFAVLSERKWKLHKDGYAYRTERQNGRYVNVYMHRAILGITDKRRVDHINRDKLDNRRENLRAATQSQNLHNSGKPKHNRSGHKGVYWMNKRNRWCAQIRVDGHHYHLGVHATLDDALAAYEAGRRRLLGEFA
jgi:hypothetical protein